MQHAADDVVGGGGQPVGAEGRRHLAGLLKHCEKLRPVTISTAAAVIYSMTCVPLFLDLDRSWCAVLPGTFPPGCRQIILKELGGAIVAADEEEAMIRRQPCVDPQAIPIIRSSNLHPQGLTDLALDF